MLSFENFVKSMPPSLSELKVTPSFCFAFKFPDDPTASIKNVWMGTFFQENHEPGSFQPLLQCGYDKEFSLDMKQGDTFESYKVLEILVGSSDHERKGLALRKLKRLLAPQSQENPIYFHMTNGSSNAFR